ncbi:MAG: hypothetical protein Q8K22_03065 [Rhodoferax sp.]|nr:hypothetical protein [Rhodoferax sp.]
MIMSFSHRLRLMLLAGLLCANAMVFVLSGNSLYISRQHVEQRVQSKHEGRNRVTCCDV